MSTSPHQLRPITKVQGVIFDWAGTTIDFGSRAPAQVFREIFIREGVHVTEQQAREPMGRAKRDHIAAVLQNPAVKTLWQQVKGRDWTDADIDRLYDCFLPLQREILGQYVDLIPGMTRTVSWLQRRGIRIGSTTGYTRALMEVVIPKAAEAGYQPEAIVCSDDVSAGRPAPWMLLEAARQLNVYPIATLVKVDDTPVGIDAGLNAGCWTVAVTTTGNELGLSSIELAELPADVRKARVDAIQERFMQGGAHLTIESVADLPGAIETIESWMREGCRP